MTQQLPSDAEKERQEQLQRFVDLAFQKGILDAITEVKKMNDPYLTDAFHDLLVDKLYDELIARRKLDELK